MRERRSATVALSAALLLALLAPRPSSAIEPMRRMRGFPPRLLATEQVRIELRYERGRVRSLGLTRERLREPRRFRRFVGRYRADLYAGSKRIEVAPFNFPMLGHTESQNEQEREFKRRFRANLTTQTRVSVPSRADATHILIIDPAGKTVLRLELPRSAPRRPKKPSSHPSRAPKTSPSPKPTPAPKPAPTPMPKTGPSPAPKPAPAPSPKPGG